MGPPPFGGGKLCSGRCLGGGARASMGPPPFGGGKDPRLSRRERGLCQLQWGHLLSAVERPDSTRTGGFVCTASMGPPPFGGGKNDVGRWRREHHVQASMGPPPFGGGKLRFRQAVDGADPGFNGATSFRRWKASSRASLSRPPSGFNGATSFRRWKGVGLTASA